MHKDVITRSGSSKINFPIKQGDNIRIIRNDDVMIDYIVMDETASFASYIEREFRQPEFK